MKTFDPDVIEFTNQLRDWHESRVQNLQLIVENPTADLMLGTSEIKADSDLAKGIRIGIQLALAQLGKLPFSVTPCTVDVVDEETE
ncbi:hypothetical protein NK214_10985 [Chromobacterium sp. S0633]|uniref:hypothetical protein n=1 Tax=Chromobacterium sp. S0633 TaxID=2957805 RepID=UPI00209D7245|nr:hypothetical protein [Chromobacterium sp. S0633]MCP1290713.1 hypothetical protein [Chromobacterium sp. S0633]